MTIQTLENIVRNELVHDESGIWLLKGHDRFAYSDGMASEQYLGEVFDKAKDLSSRSRELETYIKDWPSEYHLTRKRAQLLSGFQFERSLKVLEVGCGCGAITRHLGESFDSVVSIEGSVNRARLARQRTRGLDSVSIICAPFQEIEFTGKFDLIFCVGVYEYSGAFIAADDPYEAVLNYFSKITSDNGCLIIAIENQFGLKYFSSAGEDHLGVMFEGLEGYHKGLGRVRTFGKIELKEKLQTYFNAVDFYYPFPDYKIPDCVFSESFMASRRAGEIVANLKPRDYHLEREPLWDSAAAALELDRNGALDFFSNSFLIMASRGPANGPRFDQEGIIFSANRMERFSTVTRILKRDDHFLVSKKKIQAPELHGNGPIRLVEGESDWMDSYSLQTILHLRAKDLRRSLDSLFEPCLSWVATMRAESIPRDGVRYLGGEHVDSIWCNSYPTPEGCRIIDREWVWNEPVPFNAIVIRAIFYFLTKENKFGSVAPCLRIRSSGKLIASIARSIGVDLLPADFDRFIELETKLLAEVFGTDRLRYAKRLRWFLFDRPSLERALGWKRRARAAASRWKARFEMLKVRWAGA